MIWLALVWAFAIYWHTLHGEYVFDDNPGIRDVPTIADGRYREIQWWHWRSITQWSLALQAYAANPFPPQFSFHCGNVILHALTGFVAGHVIGWQEPGLALPGMMLWIAMPAAVNVTAYISSRATLLAGLFSVSAVWCVLSGWMALAIPLAVLALFSKEDHAGLSFSLAGVAFFTGQPWWAMFFAVAPLFAGAYFWKRIKQLRGVAHSQNLVLAGLPDPVPTEGRRLTIAVELLLRFPQWVMGVGYCIAPHFKRPNALRVLGAAAVAILAVVAAVLLPDTRLPLWLALTSPLPLYALFIEVRDPVQDYRNYFSMLGPLMFAVPLMPFWFISGLVVVWAVASAHRAFDWQNPEQLWKGAIRDGAGPLAWQNLGAVYHGRGEFREARRCYEECLRDYPDTGVALLNLALMEGQTGNPEGARDKIEECVQKWPRYRTAWDYLSQVYAFLKDEPNATRCRERAKELLTV